MVFQKLGHNILTTIAFTLFGSRFGDNFPIEKHEYDVVAIHADRPPNFFPRQRRHHSIMSLIKHVHLSDKTCY